VDFVAIDVETANPDVSSICQVGIASFRNGELVDSWESLVNPEGEFSSFNISIHGIDERRVRHAPNWRAIYPEVALRLQSRIVVSHTPFDRHAVTGACDRCSLAVCECRWLDSAQVVRKTWLQFSRSGYGLPNLAAYFGISYQAHDALEDARCAGLVLLRAIAETKISAEQWLTHATQPSGLVRPATSHWKSFPPPAKRKGNPNGPLFGEILVFTGSLSMTREAAADAAAAAGCRVDDGVTKHTTMLVVGDQDTQRFAVHKKSSKHLKAEQLIANGQRLRILCERDFMSIVRQ